VFERDAGSGARSSGYGMTMQACSALRDLGVLDEVKAQDTPSTEHWTFSPEGHVLGYFGNGLQGDGIFERELGERGNLRIPRDALLKIMRDHLPSGSIRWGHRLESFEEMEGGVWLKFCSSGNRCDENSKDLDMIESPPPFFASVLVGADGLRSRVRSLALSRSLGGASPPLSHMGVVLLLGISSFEHPLLSARGFYTIDGFSRLFTMPFSTHPKPLHMWQLSFSSPEHAGLNKESHATALRTLSPQALLEMALKITKNWHSPCQELISGSIPGSVWATSLADLGGGAACIGEFAQPPSQPPLTRVVLIGDASHPMSPFKGQGANQALMDGPQLASWLCKASVPAALRAFEREMGRRAGAKVFASRAAAVHLHSPSVLSNAPEVKGLPQGVSPVVVLQRARAQGVGAHLGENLLGAFRGCVKQVYKEVLSECGGAVLSSEEGISTATAPPPSQGGVGISGAGEGKCTPLSFAASDFTTTTSSSSTATAISWTLLYYCYAPLGVDGRAAMLDWLSGPRGPMSGGCVGRIRVGLDGINATIGAPSKALLEAHATNLISTPNPLSPTLASTPIDFKYAPSKGPRSREAVHGCCFDGPVRLVSCAEIVTLGVGKGEARAEDGGLHLSPSQFHSRLLQLSRGPSSHGAPSAAVMIDVRNMYEHAVGRLIPPPPTVVVSPSGATITTGTEEEVDSLSSPASPVKAPCIPLLLPPVRTFAEMPAWLDAHPTRETLSTVKEVFMYCTGGVRCERFSALVKNRFPGTSVYQLEGGIQRYMEAGERGELEGGCFWKGKLFVFDERPAVSLEDSNKGDVLPAVGDKSEPGGIIGACILCETPWDTYLGWLRCSKCGILVLVCASCQEKRGRLEGVPSPLSCHRCSGKT